MQSTVNITEAQAQLPKLVRSRSIRGITRHGETVSFLVPRERMEALLESMEILANPKAVAALRRDQSGRGRYLALAEMERRLDEDPR